MNWRVLLVVSSYTMLAASLAWVWWLRDPAPHSDLFWDERVRLEVQQRIEEHYLEPLDPAIEEQLFDAALRGYVRALDPFSRYFDAEERRELEEDTRGEFGGIGVQVRTQEGAGALVVAVRIGGPAERAGLAPGDRIETADGTPLAGRDLPGLVALLKGAPGSTVLLGLSDAEGRKREALVQRALVELDSIPYVHVFGGEEGKAAPPLGYVRIESFSEPTGAEFGRALERLGEAGVQGLVIDLRRNAGGVVRGAVGVAERLLPAGLTVCQTHGREQGEDRVSLHVTQAVEGSAPSDLPLVVLVDQDSASASEILAGALQDHGRAVLVGTRTFGKFLVQTLYPLESRDALVRITTARYETPRGRTGQRDAGNGRRGGLLPDVRVPLADAEAERALLAEFSEQTDERAWRVLPAARGRAPRIDAQLAVALALLRGAGPPAEPLERAP